MIPYLLRSSGKWRSLGMYCASLAFSLLFSWVLSPGLPCSKWRRRIPAGDYLWSICEFRSSFYPISGDWRHHRGMLPFQTAYLMSSASYQHHFDNSSSFELGQFPWCSQFLLGTMHWYVFDKLRHILPCLCPSSLAHSVSVMSRVSLSAHLVLSTLSLASDSLCESKNISMS